MSATKSKKTRIIAIKADLWLVSVMLTYSNNSFISLHNDGVTLALFQVLAL